MSPVLEVGEVGDEAGVGEVAWLGGVGEMGDVIWVGESLDELKLDLEAGELFFGEGWFSRLWDSGGDQSFFCCGCHGWRCVLISSRSFSSSSSHLLLNFGESLEDVGSICLHCLQVGESLDVIDAV